MTRRLLATGLLAVASAVVGQGHAQETAERLPAGRPTAYQRQRIVPPSVSGGWPTGRRSYAGYQRTRPTAMRPHFGHGIARPVVSHGAWFQRPYPYHLDYYRLRYGGTYEPYYGGGLYGTPQVIVPPALGYGYGYGYGYGPFGPPVPRAEDAPVEDAAAEDAGQR